MTHFVSNQPVPQSTSSRTSLGSVGILHLINGEHYSGAERVQDLLGTALKPFDYKVAYACLKRGRFVNERKSKGNRLFSLSMKARFDLRCVPQLCNIVRDHDYKLIHTHTPRTLMVGSFVASRCNVPLVYHVHSPVGRDSHRTFQNRINQRVETWFTRSAARLVCVSDSVRDYMEEWGYDPKRLVVVPNGVPIVNDLAPREAPQGTWTIGTTALFRPRKGTEVLLQALAKLKKAGVPVRLLAVGPFETNDYERDIKTLTDELGIADIVEWTGFQSDVNSFFQQMDLFVLPSLYGEGLPMVVLEAMANGVPVVAADVEGIPQAIRHGQDGLIFQPGEVDDLAQQVQSLQEGTYDWTSLRTAALIRQRESFSDQSMARSLAWVYDQIFREL